MLLVLPSVKDITSNSSLSVPGETGAASIDPIVLAIPAFSAKFFKVPALVAHSISVGPVVDSDI